MEGTDSGTAEARVGVHAWLSESRRRACVVARDVGERPLSEGDFWSSALSFSIWQSWYSAVTVGVSSTKNTGALSSMHGEMLT